MLIRIAIASALLTAVSSCACTDVGCISEVNAHVATSLDGAGLRLATVSICRNAQCLEGSAGAQRPDAGVQGAFLLSESSGASATVVFGSAGAIDITYTVQDSNDLHDGDHYVITVTDERGGVVGGLDQTVSYGESAPNGSACGPVCRHATL